MPAVAVATISEAKTEKQSLKQLIPAIKRELRLGNAAGMEHFREAGRLLIAAQQKLYEERGHGHWQKWLRRNFRLSESTAFSYMALVRLEKSRRAKFLTLSQARQPNRGSHHASWHEPVRKITDRVNVEKLAQEYRRRDEENALIVKLASQIIDIGFKILAAKLHPDKPGGSHEAMARLTKARDVLRGAIA
jgi:hypothetical protein